jgi:hypothetical protein
LDQIPRQAVKLLKEGLARIHPGLVERKWEGSRLCWSVSLSLNIIGNMVLMRGCRYCDSPSSDWLIDYHPKHPSLFLATAGSGHAFKVRPPPLLVPPPSLMHRASSFPSWANSFSEPSKVLFQKTNVRNGRGRDCKSRREMHREGERRPVGRC